MDCQAPACRQAFGLAGQLRLPLAAQALGCPQAEHSRDCSHWVSRPVSVSAARSSKPPACSWYPGFIETLVLGFFPRYRLAAQSKAGSDPVELADAGGVTEVLVHCTLHRWP